MVATVMMATALRLPLKADRRVLPEVSAEEKKVGSAREARGLCMFSRNPGGGWGVLLLVVLVAIPEAAMMVV